MKLKGDFITNSSSAAFILFGWRIPDNVVSEIREKDEEGEWLYEIIERFLSDNKIQLSHHTESEYDDVVIIGTHISSVDNGESQEIPLSILQEKLENNEELLKLKELLNLEGDPKLIVYGSCMG